jgi:hypothetical protein
MFCTSCGTELKAEAKFCHSCGRSSTSQGNPSEATNTQSQIEKSNQSIRNRGIYIILGILLGLLGIHDFYAGRYKEGAIILCVTCSGFLFNLFYAGNMLNSVSCPFLISFIIVVSEVCSVKTDGEGKPFTV